VPVDHTVQIAAHALACLGPRLDAALAAVARLVVLAGPSAVLPVGGYAGTLPRQASKAIPRLIKHRYCWLLSLSVFELPVPEAVPVLRIRQEPLSSSQYY